MGIEIVVVVCGAVATLGAAGVWHAWQVRVDPAHLARTPRDLGKLALNERFGRRVAEGESNGRDQACSDDSLPAARDPQSTLEAAPDRYSALEAAAQGAWIGLAPLENLLAIDEHVYSGMSRLAGEQLETIADLSTYLASWPSAEFGSALPDESLNKLMGHLAEPEVAAYLESLGIRVDMPDASNQAGWDLILNGEHMVNVKTVADANALTGHFELYPDIPVIVPSDMDGIPDQAIHLDSAGSIDQLLTRSVADGEGNSVIVDHALEQSAMIEHAEKVSDALLGNVDIADVTGIPLITLALSGFREVGLLCENKTSVANAVKNLSLDVAGTGGGATGGALIGVEIGSLIMPGVGTAVGGFLGAIAGAITGKSATDWVKHEPLRSAFEAYEKSSAAASDKVKRIHRRAVRDYTHAQEEQQAGLKAVAERQRDRLATACQDIIEQQNVGYRLEEEQARRLVRIALRDLDRGLRRAQVFAARRVRRCLLPLRFIGAWQPAVREYKAMRLRLQADLEELIARHRNEDGTLHGKAASTFLQTLLSADAASEQVRKHVREAEDQRRSRESAFRDCIHDVREAVARRRHECFWTLARQIEEIREQCEKKVRRIGKRLDALMQNVREEQAKLGMGES